jgi:hypothetical protein
MKKTPIVINIDTLIGHLTIQVDSKGGMLPCDIEGTVKKPF